MKRNTLTIMLAVLMSMAASVASAYDAQIGGIYYNFSGNVAIVTYKYIGMSNYSGSVVIPESVTYNRKTYSVTSIDSYAFSDCSGLTSITIPNSVVSIGERAFSYCSGLTSITIPNSVVSIGESTFSGCSGLTSVTIPNSVTSIGSYAFNGCSSLKSITIGNSVTTIGNDAFCGCSRLTSIKVEEGNAKYDSRDNCNAIIETITNTLIFGFKNTIIPNSVMTIGSYAFAYCSGLTSITIPNSVTTIGSYAFAFCRSLTSVNFPNSVTSIGYYAFGGCSGLISMIIPSSVTWIGSDTFKDCSGLKLLAIFKDYNIDIPNGCSVVVPSSLYATYRNKTYDRATIYTMDRCNLTQTTITVEEASPEYFKLQSVALGNNEVEASDGTVKITELSPNKTYRFIIIGEDTFGNTVSWTISETTKGINIGIMKEKEITNTTMTIGKPSYDAGDAKVKSAEFVGYGGKDEINITGLAPGETKNITYRVITSDGSVFNKESSFQTKMVKANGTSIVISASSATLKGSLSNLIDATIDKIGFEENGYTSNEIQLTGLNPNTSYTKRFKATFKEGGEAYKDITFRTSTLTLEAQQPKVISEGNVIVAAKTNIDDKELNIGFEWRRTDWTNDFDSKTGSAYLYNGEMEGYIRSLNPNYLWKFRPYYTSSAGNTYYGEWKGMDPSDYSYFEPTVHTYATINVQGNRAEVKGYAMRGTDNVVSQGFMYWESNTSVSLRKRAASVPNGAKVVNASGNVMTATLEDLEYETTYKYVAFVTTSEGETFYGEMQTFSTSADPDGIEEIKASKDAVEVARYDIHGRKIANPQRGINIIRFSDGSSRKVLVK